MVVALLMGFHIASAAHSCTCPFFTYWGFIGPESSRMPANAKGTIWVLPEVDVVRLDSGEFEYVGKSAELIEELTSNLDVEILKDGEYEYVEVPASITEYRASEFLSPETRLFLVAPADGFIPGATYRFTDRNHERWYRWPYGLYHQTAFQQVTITVDDEELTAQDMLLDVSSTQNHDTLRVASGGMCSSEIEARTVRIFVETPVPEWRGGLLYRTWVDGKRWQGRDSLCHRVVPGRSMNDSEPGTDTVYAGCDIFTERMRRGLVEDGIDPDHYWSWGALRDSFHTLKVEAFLPGTDVVFESEPIRIDLRCLRPHLRSR